MANWKKNIRIEVRLPYITHGCTLGYINAKIDVSISDVWISGNAWKASISWGEYSLMVSGKATYTTSGIARPTTYKVSVSDYKSKVISYE